MPTSSSNTATRTEFCIGAKSNSYIFAIERNSIPTPLRLSPLALDTSDYHDQQQDGRELLIIPPRKRSAPAPLSSQQVELYCNDVHWKRVRWIWYLVFWFGWLLALLFALVLTYSYPKCVATQREWWKDTIIYEIWSFSFDDSDGDGFGDLGGITAHVDDLRRIGVGAIFARPLLKVDSSGLGAISHRELAAQIGRMEQFVRLVDLCHRQGIKVLLDFPLVITSIAHPWFRRSALAARPENVEYADFYHWRRNIADSDHISAFEGSLLKYFHVKGRPDLPVLAWHNSNVSNAIKNALSFWIEKGVDGFHLSAIDYLHRSPDGRQPDWDGVMPILRTIRTHIDEQWALKRTRSGDQKIFLFASQEHLSETVKRRLVTMGGLDVGVNTELRKLAVGNRVCSNFSASLSECANEVLSDLLLFHQKRGAHVWPLWTLGSAYTRRLASRVDGRANAELLMLLVLVLPGTPVVYYGDELAMRDANNLRFPQRSTMLWRADTTPLKQCRPLKHKQQLDNATLAPDFLSGVNFADELHDAASFLHNFRRLARLRQRGDKTLAEGRTYITRHFDQTFALCRYLAREMVENGEATAPTEEMIYGDVLIVAVNFATDRRVLSLVDLPPFHIRGAYRKARVLARSSNSAQFGVGATVDIGDREVHLDPSQGVVLKALYGS